MMTTTGGDGPSVFAKYIDGPENARPAPLGNLIKQSRRHADLKGAAWVPDPRLAQLIQPGAAAAVITVPLMAWLAEIAISLSQFASLSAGDG